MQPTHAHQLIAALHEYFARCSINLDRLTSLDHAAVALGEEVTTRQSHLPMLQMREPVAR